jgi:hypothetical protein
MSLVVNTSPIEIKVVGATLAACTDAAMLGVRRFVGDVYPLTLVLVSASPESYNISSGFGAGSSFGYWTCRFKAGWWD